MKRTLPSFDDAVTELADLIPHIFRALEAGVLFARAFFDDTTEGERPHDPYLFAMLVRYRAKMLLDSDGTKAEIDLDPEWLPNIGLKVAYGGYLVRIRLALDLRLPVPGNSLELQDFYRQLPEVMPLPIDLDELEPPTPELDVPIKLVFIWRALPPAFHLEARLACPRDARSDRDSISEWWIESLAYPVQEDSPAQDVEPEDLPTESTEAAERESAERERREREGEDRAEGS